MRRSFLALALVLATGLVGCSSEEAAAPPKPYALTTEAIGRYCGMNVLEHDGPKGQVILKHIPEPIWFSSARDAVAFNILPDEPKDIAAIYVSDMGAAPSWEKPGADNWIEARNAFFVIGSSRKGGMNVDETVPFSSEEAASQFVAQHGGRVVRFNDIPQTYVLGAGEDAPQPTAASQKDHTGH